MKGYILFTVLLCTSLAAMSQDAILPVQQDRKHEIGIIGESVINNATPDDISMIGLQYKKWKTKHLGFRVIAAYGEYNYRAGNNSIAEIINDTFVQKAPFTRVDMAIVGLGVEAQRQFYKKVYLFAALELKGGYGAGDVDTMVDKTYKENKGITTFSTNTGPKNEATAFSVGISPTIGAKFQFKYVSFGAEMVSHLMTVKNVSYDNARSFGGVDMDMGKIGTRIFFSYKF